MAVPENIPAAKAAVPMQEEAPLVELAAPPRAGKSLWIHAVTLAILVASLALWELFTRTGLVSALLVPGPIAVSEALAGLVREPWFPEHLLTTTIEMLAGFAVAAVVGVPLGIVLANFRLARRLLFPYVVVAQVIPKIALAPIFIIWFGPGVNSKIVLASAIAIFPAVINTMLGIETVDENARLLMRSLRSSRWQLLTKLQLPTSTPAIVAGLESSLTIVLIGVIAGEFISAEAGLGTLLLTFEYNFQIPAVFATMVVISALGLAAYLAFVIVARRLLRRPGLGVVI